MKNCACPPPRPPLEPGRTRHNEYLNPSSPQDRVMFWHNVGYCSECGARKIWYATAPQTDENWSWRAAEPGNHLGSMANPCLYRWPAVRKELRRSRYTEGGVIVWAEGEKDARAGARLLSAAREGEAATSHHGGAGKATEEQAEHFRGYGGTVLLAVDRDDAGAACGLRRFELLRAVELPARRIRLVRAADGAGGGSGSGVDLADHVAAGYGLRDLVRVRRADLVAAADRHTDRVEAGWRYPDPETVAAIAENKRRHGGRFVIKFKRAS